MTGPGSRLPPYIGPSATAAVKRQGACDLQNLTRQGTIGFHGPTNTSTLTCCTDPIPFMVRSTPRSRSPCCCDFSRTSEANGDMPAGLGAGGRERRATAGFRTPILVVAGHEDWQTYEPFRADSGNTAHLT